MQYAIHFYRLINILSLDVAFGAAISSYFFSRIFNVSTDIPALLCLGLTVWLIYTVDHLIDAKLIKGVASSWRHQYHQRNFKVILYFLIAAIFLIIALLFFIQPEVFYWGLYLSALVIIYLMLQRKLGPLKEVLGALLYTGGVIIPVVAISDQMVNTLVSLPTMLFFNTALINLILFSWFDLDHDAMDKQPSIATILGGATTRKLLGLLFMAQFCLILYTYFNGHYNSNLLVFALMFVILFSVFIKSRWFGSADKYRIAGDAVFFIPLLHAIL